MTEPIYTVPQPKKIYRAYMVIAVFFSALLVWSVYDVLTIKPADYSTLFASAVFLVFGVASFVFAKNIKRIRLWEDGIELLSYNGEPLKKVLYKDMVSIKLKGKKSKSIAHKKFIIKTERDKMKVHMYMNDSALWDLMLQGAWLHTKDDDRYSTYQGDAIMDHRTLFPYILNELETKAPVYYD